MSSETNARSGRRTAVRFVVTAALFAVVVFAVEQLVPGASHRLAHASPGWLAIALGLELLACSAYVLLFQTVFSRARWPLQLRRGIQIALAELGAFAITPTGFGGPAVRVWGLRVGGMPWRVLIVRSIAHGVIFNVPYALAAALVGVGVSMHFLPGHAPLLTALAPLTLVAAACAAYGAAAWLGQRAGSPTASPRRQWLRSALATIPEGIADAFVVSRSGWPLLGATGWWVADCAALWAGFEAVGGRPALSVVILAYMLGQLGNTLPLPGGVGGVEPLMLGIFSASGVNLGLAAAAVVCYRTISLGVQGIAGSAAFVSLASDLRAERRSRPGSPAGPLSRGRVLRERREAGAGASEN
jgi:uncharacterized membrane protein YbhN (UPF0104 family)